MRVWFIETELINTVVQKCSSNMEEVTHRGFPFTVTERKQQQQQRLNQHN